MDDYSEEDEKLVITRHPKKRLNLSSTAPLKEFIHPDDLEEDNRGQDTEQTKMKANISNN